MSDNRRSPDNAVERALITSSTCCDKAAFATKRVADCRLRYLQSTADQFVPGSTYRCRNGWWHITKLRAATPGTRNS